MLLRTGTDPRKMGLDSILNLAYAMLLEGCADKEEVEELERTLHYEPVTLKKAIDAVVIEGDEIIPSMVPSWWKGDEEAFAEAQNVQKFVKDTGGSSGG